MFFFYVFQAICIVFVVVWAALFIGALFNLLVLAIVAFKRWINGEYDE